MSTATAAVEGPLAGQELVGAREIEVQDLVRVQQHGPMSMPTTVTVKYGTYRWEEGRYVWKGWRNEP